MPIGMITLVVVAVLVYFGVAQRVLDRMGLTDRVALLFIAASVFGSYLPAIPLTDTRAINVGGGLVTIALSLYLLFRADTARERSRAIIATIIAAAAIYGAMKILPTEPTFSLFLDPMYIFALLAGGDLFGIWGVLLAVPVAAVLKVLVRFAFYHLVD